MGLVLVALLGRVGDAPEAVALTVIRYSPASSAAASSLGQRIKPEPVYLIDETLTNVLLVLGPDFDQVSSTSAPATTEPPPSTVGDVEAQPEPQPVAPEHEVGVVPRPGPEGTACA